MPISTPRLQGLVRRVVLLACTLTAPADDRPLSVIFGGDSRIGGDQPYDYNDRRKMNLRMAVLLDDGGSFTLEEGRRKHDFLVEPQRLHCHEVKSFPDRINTEQGCSKVTEIM